MDRETDDVRASSFERGDTGVTVELPEQLAASLLESRPHASEGARIVMDQQDAICHRCVKNVGSEPRRGNQLSAVMTVRARGTTSAVNGVSPTGSPSN